MGARTVSDTTGDAGTAGGSPKPPNERLASWFGRSGWSKGELARQVNRRAGRLGVHHVGTDTSRVRRWLDGEQPREPIPTILSELFSERFGCVVTIEDLGLRATRRAATTSGVDLPWAGPRTAEMINEFSRSDLMFGRRGFLGSSLTVSAGPALIEPMQRWLAPGPTGAPGAGHDGSPDHGVRALPARPSVASPAAPSVPPLSGADLDLLDATTTMFRGWDAQSGGGLRRKAVVGQLHEVTDLLRESRPGGVRRRLFRVTAELSSLAGWMSYDIGLQPTAQKYFVLALHAAREAGDRPLGALVLSQMARQMIHLGRPADALELVTLAQYGGRENAGARLLAMLHALEARARASLGQTTRCRRAVETADDVFADIDAAEQEPDWIAFFTLAELHTENGHAYRDLAYATDADPDHTVPARQRIGAAVELFRGELERRELAGEPGPRRSYALGLIGLSTVHLLCREPEVAAERAMEALEVAGRLRSERVCDRLRRTAAAAAREFGDVPAVARLQERVAVELSGAAIGREN
ncbi:hypothetical protein GCM10027160_43540 [Streptomyces calidiresistens]|uniref:NsdA n=2 Tax=Streptomyces calidiresistens TaxID=1485586 RepID=A0A7W3T3S4_9ACTN|nr:hypothetical protein [Streptomyces calidiresistens]MBB0230388.1 hypothetical protein [Streptomyces calidiresistens]